jgi:hypothetical protein
MTRTLIVIVVSLTLIFATEVYSSNQIKFKCKSERGLIEWRYDNKYLYEVYTHDSIRKYEIDSKDTEKLFARNKEKNTVWYAVFDFKKKRIDVQGPYGQYLFTECAQK